MLSRDTAAQAWAEADRIQAGFDPAVIESVRQRKARMDSVGQSRMAALHEAETPVTRRRSDDRPNLWSGIGLVREGVGTALVGSHDEVAERLSEYVDAGIDEFILSGYPHLEEADPGRRRGDPTGPGWTACCGRRLSRHSANILPQRLA